MDGQRVNYLLKDVCFFFQVEANFCRIQKHECVVRKVLFMWKKHISETLLDRRGLLKKNFFL